MNIEVAGPCHPCIRKIIEFIIFWVVSRRAIFFYLTKLKPLI